MILQADFLNEAGLVEILARLEGAGFQALVVGGAVRNLLLDHAIADIDLATSATPDEVTELLWAAGLRVIPTGLAHGTVTVLSGHKTYEITTFRKDVVTDGRHAQVVFTDDLVQDAARRDFTMNALYLTRAGRLIDPLGGLDDVLARRLRFVGEASQRIAEDYLRILRFFRFLACYGDASQADPSALAAIAEGRQGLAQVSAERIGDEMRKLLAAPDPSGALRLMQETGVLEQLLPDATAELLPRLVELEHGFGVSPDWLRRLAALGGGGPSEVLRLSRSETRAIAALVRAKTMTPEAAAYHLGMPVARDAALLGLASGETMPQDWQARIAAARSLPITARDLPDLSGPLLGQTLKYAAECWISSGFSVSNEKLITGAMAFAHGKT